MRANIPLLVVLALWPVITGAMALMLINGLGPSGAFTEPPSSAWRSLRMAIQEGFQIGVIAMPFLSLLPAALVFLGRRFLPLNLPDALIGAAAGLIGLVLFLGWTLIEPLDPLLGGLPILVGVALVGGGAITGMLIALLRPRKRAPDSTP